jgi:hypothetical protein
VESASGPGERKIFKELRKRNSHLVEQFKTGQDNGFRLGFQRSKRSEKGLGLPRRMVYLGRHESPAPGTGEQKNTGYKSDINESDHESQFSGPRSPSSGEAANRSVP